MINFFKDLQISNYTIENKLDTLLNLKNYGDFEKKLEHSIYEAVDPNNKTPYLPELDDLSRLHFLATTRKTITILEFGVGYSTLVLADALYKNKQRYQEYVSKNLRYSNPFELHCVDANEHFLKITEEKIPEHLKEFVQDFLLNGEITNEKVSVAMLGFGIFMIALGFRKHEQKR